MRDTRKLDERVVKTFGFWDLIGENKIDEFWLQPAPDDYLDDCWRSKGVINKYRVYAGNDNLGHFKKKPTLSVKPF